MEIMEALKNFGLAEKEAKVYLCVLGLGEALASEISSKTNISRQLIYDLIKRLTEHGLVSSIIKDNKKYFRVAPPEQFYQILREKENGIEDVMTELKKIQNYEEHKKPKIEVYEGVEGMKTIMNDILRVEKKEIIVFGSSKSSFNVMPLFMENWHNRRIKQKLKARIIYNRADETKKRIDEFKDTLKLMDVRFLLVEAITPTATLIYGNKIAFMVWLKDEPYATLIESKELKNSYAEYFEKIWKIAKK
jgi:sugar-specific transcriptional regulator TrmB